VHPGSVIELQDIAHIKTPAQSWGYAAQFPLLNHSLKAPLWVLVHANVTGAPIGVGILNQEGDDFVARTSLNPGERTATLRVPRSASMGDLIVQSWNQGGPAQVAIESITVMAVR